MRNRFKSIHLKVLILVLILFLVMGLSWYQLRPRAVVIGGLNRISSAKSLGYEANIQIENEEITSSLFGEQAIVKLVAIGNFVPIANSHSSLQADTTISIVSESITLLIEAEIRMIDENVYLFIKKAPPAITFINQLKGRWFVMPRSNESEESALQLDGEVLENYKRAGHIKVDNKNVFAYQANLTAQGILKILDNIANTLGNRLTVEQINEFKQGVANVESIPVTFAISPLFRDIRQIGVAFQLPGNANKITFILSFFNRNNKVNIEVPQGAVTFQEYAKTISEQKNK